MSRAFYGHRRHLYRDTQPHDGFRILLEWGKVLPGGYFVLTSNVDGQFQKAGFAPKRILEQHGSVHRLQYTVPCRPTEMMFDDLQFVPDMQREQTRRYGAWLASVRGRRVVILEFGAGTAIDTARARWYAPRDSAENPVA